jgi:hypothetical protein
MFKEAYLGETALIGSEEEVSDATGENKQWVQGHCDDTAW